VRFRSQIHQKGLERTASDFLSGMGLKTKKKRKNRKSAKNRGTTTKKRARAGNLCIKCGQGGRGKKARFAHQQAETPW